MTHHAGNQATAAGHRSKNAAPSEPEKPAGAGKTAAAMAKRPDTVPPGRLNRIVYLSYALIGLAFALYNANLVGHQMALPEEDPGFAAAALFFCMGMIPTVIALYITAGLKDALIKKLGIKTIFVLGGILVLFSLFLWAVLIASQADARSTLIGFFLPMVVRVTFQDTSETISEANQRVVGYFSGMILAIGIGWLLTKYTKFDADARGETFAFSMVVLMSQLLQIWHAALQILAIFKWERQPVLDQALQLNGSR